MVNTIDMQDMRHLNLFENITKVNTRFCFGYNNSIIFCVPKSMMFRAIGENGKNIKKLNQIIGKRIKIIAKPNGIEDVRYFIEDIVNPVRFKNLEIRDNEIIITAGGTQNKAALLGRNKQRLLEMHKIIKDFFGRELRIV